MPGPHPPSFPTIPKPIISKASIALKATPMHLTLRLSCLLFALLALAFSTACLPEEEEPKARPEKEWKPPKEAQPPNIKGRYIGGTLGAYESCPDQGYNPSIAPVLGDKRGDRDIICERGSRCGSQAPACDHAQISVDLENRGLGDAKEIAVQSIDLLDEQNRVLASLPLIEVQNLLTMTAFDGTVAAGNNRKSLRIQFQGPVDPEILRFQHARGADIAAVPCLPEEECGGGGGFGQQRYLKIRVTFSLADHPDVVIESHAIYTSSQVAT